MAKTVGTNSSDLEFGVPGEGNVMGFVGGHALSRGIGDNRQGGVTDTDCFFGNGGDDTFIFVDGRSQEVTLNFNAGSSDDRIVLRNLGLTTIQEILDIGTDTASGFVLRVGDNQLTLPGIRSSQLDANAFIIRNRVTNLASDALQEIGLISDNGTVLITANQGLLANNSGYNADTLIINSVNGNNANLNIPVQGSDGGLFIIREDGSYGFSTGNDFDDLAVGEARNTTVQFTITNGKIESATAKLTVTVIGENDTPTVLSPLMVSVSYDTEASEPCRVNIGRPSNLKFSRHFNRNGINDRKLGAKFNTGLCGGNNIQNKKSSVSSRRDLEFGETVQRKPANFENGKVAQGEGSLSSNARDIKGNGLGDFLSSAPFFVSDKGETAGAFYYGI